MVFEVFQNLLISHLKTLNSQLLPIQRDVNNRSKQQDKNAFKSKQRYHFGIPLLISVFVTIYGTFYLPAQAANFDSSWTENLTNNRYLVTHQIVPRSLWRHFDMGSLLTVIASTGILFYATVRRDLETNFQISLSCKDQQRYSIGKLLLDAEVSSAVAIFQKRIPILIWSSILPFFIVALSFYYVNLVLNDAYTVGPFSLIYWILLFPLWIFYLFYACLGFLLYIVISSRILRIRQVYLLRKLQLLSKKRRSKSVPNEATAYHQILVRWRKFTKANQLLLHICKHIQENSRLNNPVLSILLPYFMLYQPFMLRVLFEVDSGPLEKLFCSIAVLEGNAVLYLLIQECSAIDLVNDQLEGSLRKFNVCLSKSTRESTEDDKVIQLPILTWLKAELLQTTDRLKPYTYCAFGTFRLVATSYYTVTSFNYFILIQKLTFFYYKPQIALYASSFYMFIFKAEFNKQKV